MSRFLEEILIPGEQDELITLKAASGSPSLAGEFQSPERTFQGRVPNPRLRRLLDETRDYLES